MFFYLHYTVSAQVGDSLTKRVLLVSMSYVLVGQREEQMPARTTVVDLLLAETLTRTVIAGY